MSNRDQERQVLACIMDTLTANGYQLLNAYDSEEWMGREETAVSKQIDVIAWAMAADFGAIRYLDPQGERFTLHLVMGNSPWELVADLSGANEEAIERGNKLIIPITDQAEATLR